MQQSWRSLGILTVITLARSSPIKAHNPMIGVTSAASGEGVGPHSLAGSTVGIQLFQYPLGRVKTIAGRRVYVIFGTASGHMAMITNPLADAIVTRFPVRYAQR